MIGTLLGAVVGWGGFLFVVYGFSQVRGCNAGLGDLAWPGRTISCSPDGDPNNYQPGVGTGPGGSNAGNPPGYSAGSKTPGGSTTTPPAGWTAVPGTSPQQYYSSKQPGEIWISGIGILQQ